MDLGSISVNISDLKFEETLGNPNDFIYEELRMIMDRIHGERTHLSSVFFTILNYH